MHDESKAADQSNLIDESRDMLLIGADESRLEIDYHENVPDEPGTGGN